MTLVGLCGKMGVGKDYIANTIILPYMRNVLGKTAMTWCFADQLKVNAMTKYKLDYSNVYEDKTQHTRQLLQQEGTEYGRDLYGQDIWISYLDKWTQIMQHRGIEHFVITDVRFKNEIEYIKSRKGLVLKINAPNRNKQRLDSENGTQVMKTHKSECDLDSLDDKIYDLVVDNDTDGRLNIESIHDLLKKLVF